VLGVAALVASTQFTLDHPRAKGHKIVVTSVGAVRKDEPGKISGRLVVREPNYDFGVLDPRTMGKHVFVLENLGPGPITLMELGTSCSKCTVASLSKNELQAGETSEVQVEFDCGPGPHYSQTATIGVQNDPTTKSVQLRVEGRVRMHFGALPAEHNLEAIDPGKTATARSLIYSEKFTEAEVLEVKTSNPEFKAELQEPEAGSVKDIEPTWAKELVITTPPTLPTGAFSEMVWVTLRLPSTKEGEAGEIKRIDITLKGGVNRGLSISGEEIDFQGMITLGILPYGKEKQVQFTLKLKHKEARDLMLERIECNPSFIDVKITPKPNVDPALGLYDMRLTIPATAPTCNFMREAELGQIRLFTKNPFVGELPLAIRFAIREDG
jgi:hypothetical protein